MDSKGTYREYELPYHDAASLAIVACRKLIEADERTKWSLWSKLTRDAYVSQAELTAAQ